MVLHFQGNNLAQKYDIYTQRSALAENGFNPAKKPNMQKRTRPASSVSFASGVTILRAHSGGGRKR
jgi:hypothetical protein